MKTLVAVALITVFATSLVACSSTLPFEADKDRQGCGVIGAVNLTIERSPDMVSQEQIEWAGILARTAKEEGSVAMQEVSQELLEAIEAGDRELRDELVEKIDKDCKPVRLTPDF